MATIANETTTIAIDSTTIRTTIVTRGRQCNTAIVTTGDATISTTCDAKQDGATYHRDVCQ